jgi:superfamily II DNA or RNA helicase
MSNQDKGRDYEQFIKNFIVHKLHKNAYLWNECPENILIQNCLIDSHNSMRLLRKDVREGNIHCHQDLGIDIVQIEDTHNRCSIVQCKNGYKNGLTIENIAGVMIRAACLPTIDTYLYYTNCLSRNVKYIAGLQTSRVVPIDCSNEIDKLQEIVYGDNIYFVKFPYAKKEHKNIAVIDNNIKPYVYQIEAVDKCKTYYENNTRGIISLPCGCGKTFVGYLISCHYKHIIILSPLREFANQNLNNFIEYGYNKNNALLVDCDGIRDTESIKEFIKHNETLLISCTYDSMDVISECLGMFKDALFIIDEYHNLSKNNISDNCNNIFKLLMSEHRILFMSATPRIYDIEYDDECYDMEWMFGDVVYNMSMTEAIDRKYICDYKLWLPTVHENSEELDKELSIYDIDNVMKSRCKFLYSCLSNNGSRKCIVYCRDTEDMKAMMKSMQTLNDFYIMDVEIDSICCQDNENNRKEKLHKFSDNDDKIQILFNIKILNECIDIPTCDAVYISYPPKNKITTIQRMCRANRIDRLNPYKVANIYIWCNDYEEILDTLSSIKEYDIMFRDKINLNTVDFYNNAHEKDIEIVKKDKEVISIYTLGIKEFKMYTWEEKLEMVQKYIQEHNKTPSGTDKNISVRKMGRWLTIQKQLYKNKSQVFKKDNIVLSWSKFIETHNNLFKSEHEIWCDTLNHVDEYILKHDKLPSSEHKNTNIKRLGVWILAQKSNYKNNAKIMKHENIKQLWIDINNKYPRLFKNNEGKWFDYLKDLDEYIQTYNKLPMENDNDKSISTLANWVADQRYRYKKQTCIMQNENVRNTWLEFTQKHCKYFLTNVEAWKEKIAEVERYAAQNDGKLPYLTDSNPDIKVLAKWLYHQSENYKDNKQSLSNTELRTIWEDFIKRHPCRKFMTKEEYWMQSLNKVTEYIHIHKTFPKGREQKQLSTWISHQEKNYKDKKEAMIIPEVRASWENFKVQWQHLV